MKLDPIRMKIHPPIIFKSLNDKNKNIFLRGVDSSEQETFV